MPKSVRHLTHVGQLLATWQSSDRSEADFGKIKGTHGGRRVHQVAVVDDNDVGASWRRLGQDASGRTDHCPAAADVFGGTSRVLSTAEVHAVSDARAIFSGQ